MLYFGHIQTEVTNSCSAMDTLLPLQCIRTNEAVLCFEASEGATRVTGEDYSQLVPRGIKGASLCATESAKQSFVRGRTIVHANRVKPAVWKPVSLESRNRRG